jgi:hypothetical protein
MREEPYAPYGSFGLSYGRCMSLYGSQKHWMGAVHIGREPYGAIWGPYALWEQY